MKMKPKFKYLCVKCKNNFVEMASRRQIPVCYECQKLELSKEIKEPNMKKMFDIPEAYYKKNQFLRTIKISYLRYKDLSDRQISAFKEVVESLKAEEKD